MFTVATVIATITYWKIKRYFVAGLVSILCSPIVFLILCVFQAGVPQRASPSDFLIFAFMSLPSSVIVGLVFAILRRVKATVADKLRTG